MSATPSDAVRSASSEARSGEPRATPAPALAAQEPLLPGAVRRFAADEEHGDRVESTAISGGRIVALGHEGTLWIWDRESAELEARQNLGRAETRPQDKGVGIAFINEGLVAVGARNETIVVIDSATGTKRCGHHGQGRRVIALRNGVHFVAVRGDAPGEAIIFDSDCTVVHRLGYAGNVYRAVAVEGVLRLLVDDEAHSMGWRVDVEIGSWRVTPVAGSKVPVADAVIEHWSQIALASSAAPATRIDAEFDHHPISASEHPYAIAPGGTKGLVFERRSDQTVVGTAVDLKTLERLATIVTPPQLHSYRTMVDGSAFDSSGRWFVLPDGDAVILYDLDPPATK